MCSRKTSGASYSDTDKDTHTHTHPCAHAHTQTQTQTHRNTVYRHIRAHTETHAEAQTQTRKRERPTRMHTHTHTHLHTCTCTRAQKYPIRPCTPPPQQKKYTHLHTHNAGKPHILACNEMYTQGHKHTLTLCSKSRELCDHAKNQTPNTATNSHKDADVGTCKRSCEPCEATQTPLKAANSSKRKHCMTLRDAARRCLA